MFLSFVKYFPILCFPDTHFLIREGPNITPYAMDLMVRAKKILGHEGRCVQFMYVISGSIFIHFTKFIKVMFHDSPCQPDRDCKPFSTCFVSFKFKGSTEGLNESMAVALL